MQTVTCSIGCWREDDQEQASFPSPCSLASKTLLLQPRSKDLPQLIAVLGGCHPAAASRSPRHSPPGQLISGLFHAEGGNSAGSHVKRDGGFVLLGEGLFIYWFVALGLALLRWSIIYVNSRLNGQECKSQAQTHWCGSQGESGAGERSYPTARVDRDLLSDELKKPLLPWPWFG